MDEEHTKTLGIISLEAFDNKLDSVVIHVAQSEAIHVEDDTLEENKLAGLYMYRKLIRLITYHSVYWMMQEQTCSLNEVDNVSLHTLWRLSLGVVVLDTNIADWSVLLVDSVPKALAHAALVKEALGNLLLLLIIALLCNGSTELTLIHDVINLDLVQTPIQDSKHHVEGIFNDPFASTQEAQNQAVGIIMSAHAANDAADALRRLTDEILGQ